MYARLATRGNEFAFREVADGVVAAVAAPGVHPDCNAVLVDLGGEVLVVDAHARSASAEIVAAFAAHRFDAPVRTVVDTHHHWDHWQGNRAWSTRPGVRLVAHPAAIAAIRASAAASIADQRALLPGLRAAATETEQPGLDAYAAELDGLETAVAAADRSPGGARAAGIPEVEVPEVLVIAGTKREARVVHLGHAHTAGDLLVEIPHAGAVATGDTVVGWTPFLRDSDPVGWMRVLDRLVVAAPHHLLLGHGEPAGRAWLVAFRAYFADLLTETAARYGDGARGDRLVDSVREALRPAHEAAMDAGAAPGRRWSARMAGNVERVEAVLAAGGSLEWTP